MSERHDEAGQVGRSKSPSARLPRGSSSLPQQIASEIQRRRLLEAAALEVGERGYLNVSVAMLVARAGVSRKTFYQQFTDKEHCYAEALQRELHAHLKHVDAPFPDDSGPDQRLATVIGRHLERLDSDRVRARAFFVESVVAACASPLVEPVWRNYRSRWAASLQRCANPAAGTRATDTRALRTGLTLALGALDAWVSDGLRGDPPRSLSADATTVCSLVAPLLRLPADT